MAELPTVQGLKAIFAKKTPALLTLTGFQPFLSQRNKISHAMIVPSAQTNLENQIQYSFEVSAVEISSTPY
ncbi:MAG: hypothetical protein PUP91_33435 [Rhizonema sp. PD37]|nr:hypothetical protein [Rhizonema sp. PD37]